MSDNDSWENAAELVSRENALWKLLSVLCVCVREKAEASLTMLARCSLRLVAVFPQTLNLSLLFLRSVQPVSF